MSVRDLLRGLLAESGNDAAMALAVGVAGSERAFVRQMNRRARELGLTNTRYRNPIGLDEPGAYSSARDLVTLATLLRTKPFFRRTVNKESVQLTTGDHPRTFDEPQRPRAARPSGSTASRPATRATPATCSWARAAATASRSSPPCSARRASAPATPTRSRC